MAPENIAAGATVMMVLVAVVTTMINYFIFRTQVDAKVAVYLTPDPNRSTLILLVVENIGRGVARNVEFDLSRPLPTHAWGLVGSTAEIGEDMSQGPIIDGIPVLGPGSRRVITWGQYGGLSQVLGRSSTMITVRYWTSQAGVLSSRPVEDAFPLEVESFAGTDASTQPAVRIADAAETLVKSLTSAFSPFRGLTVTVKEGRLEVVVKDGDQPPAAAPEDHRPVPDQGEDEA